MKLLLIDFGASYVKTAIYSTDTGCLSEAVNTPSPFTTSVSITKKQLTEILVGIVSQYQVDGVVVCTIIGGGWINDVYYSWKSDVLGIKDHCLVSGLFVNQPTYHVHKHHNGDQDGLKVLGFISSVPIYSSLGDTNCVMESLSLKQNECAINIGTGSQVIKSDGIIKFLPAGRALLVYHNFFRSVGVDFFHYLNTTTLDDVYSSSMLVDMSVFKQALNYNGGGSISCINEGNFTIKNLTGSLLKSMVLQYRPYIEDFKNIQLTGGIPRKLPILVNLFKHYYEDKSFIVIETECTHNGMIKYINKHLI